MIDVSYMQYIYTRWEDGVRRLHRSHVTHFGSYDDFPSFVTDFVEQGIHPALATNKEDAYGWTPTMFEPNGSEAAINERSKQFGNRSRDVIAHRAGEYAADNLTLFTADLDNQHAHRRMIDLDTVEATLITMGFSFLLYTSFSHQPARHKVRIVMPVSRMLTPAEAFTVFTVFNYAFEYQLDGSIYDGGDFLYGPPLGSDIRFNLTGAVLPVDDYLALAAELPDDAKTFTTRNSSDHDRRPATAAEIENFNRRFAMSSTNSAVTINNPRYFNPDWLPLADQLYQGGSHWATMIGLLTKVWLKSGCELSRADLETIQDELDMYMGGYLSQTYCRAELARAIKDVMRQVGAPRITVAPADRAIHAAFERMKKNRRRRKK